MIMRSVILAVWLIFCGLFYSHGQDMQPGDVPINVGSLRFIRRPLAQRSINTMTSTYYYPSPRLEYFSPFSQTPLDSSCYASSLYMYYNPSLYNPQVYTHYPHVSGGHMNPLIISMSTA